MNLFRRLFSALAALLALFLRRYVRPEGELVVNVPRVEAAPLLHHALVASAMEVRPSGRRSPVGRCQFSRRGRAPYMSPPAEDMCVRNAESGRFVRLESESCPGTERRTAMHVSLVACLLHM
jgi:hypothetical protein